MLDLRHVFLHLLEQQMWQQPFNAPSEACCHPGCCSGHSKLCHAPVSPRRRATQQQQILRSDSQRLMTRQWCSLALSSMQKQG